jgi:hypothetical protein
VTYVQRQSRIGERVCTSYGVDASFVEAILTEVPAAVIPKVEASERGRVARLDRIVIPRV